jgi:tetratricopeptide (TPR) repeat protein
MASGGALVQQKGVRVFAVGVGTKAGETIPLLDARGRQVGVKTLPDGQPVVSRLDAAALEGLARRTRGRFFAADHPGGETTALKAALHGVEKGTREGRLGSRPIERFHWFALAAWLCLIASWLLPERASLRGALAKAAVLAVVFLGLPATAHAAHPLVEGNALYQKGDYRGAIRVYQAALKQHPDDPALLANLGAALYQSKDYKGAEEAFARARAQAPAAQGLASYGRGDALFREEKYREALDAFREALEKRPGDADARHNYELTLRKLHGDEEKKPPPQPKQPPPRSRGGEEAGAVAAEGADRPATPPSRGNPQGGAPSAGQSGQLSRGEAERLLDALANGEREARRAKAAAGRRRAQGEGLVRRLACAVLFLVVAAAPARAGGHRALEREREPDPARRVVRLDDLGRRRDGRRGAGRAADRLRAHRGPGLEPGDELRQRPGEPAHRVPVPAHADAHGPVPGSRGDGAREGWRLPDRPDRDRGHAAAAGHGSFDDRQRPRAPAPRRVRRAAHGGRRRADRLHDPLLPGHAHPRRTRVHQSRDAALLRRDPGPARAHTTAPAPTAGSSASARPSSIRPSAGA